MTNPLGLAGLKDPYVNFGNTYYNDHHFQVSQGSGDLKPALAVIGCLTLSPLLGLSPPQYGYFAYTAAVIAKFDPGR